MEKFSMKELLKNKYGEPEKNKKTSSSTKKSTKKKVNDGSKYKTKIVNGVKYMILR
jgi:hypothetical protein